MLADYCARFGSMIAVPVPLPARNPRRMLWRQTLDLSSVSMIDSTTLHSNSNSPIPWVYMPPLGIMTRIVHNISLVI